MIFRKNDNEYDYDDTGDISSSGIIDLFNKYKTIIIVIGIAIIGLIIFLISMNIINYNQNVENYLTLKGDQTITIYRGNAFVDPGYSAYNSKKTDLSSFVEIETNVNTEKIGTYTITYKLYDIEVTRTIEVIANPNEKTEIVLNTTGNDEEDDTNVYLWLGEEYVEPGYKVINSFGIELTDKVEIEGEVDTSKEGIYEITYSLIDLNEQLVSVTRKVIVEDVKIELIKSTNDYTNKDISINIKIDNNSFDYIELPNKEKIKIKEYTYTVNDNGIYTFTIYNKKGYKKIESVDINNIDKEAPTGSCNGIYKDRKTTVNISASDNIGIGKYVVDGTGYTSSKIVLNKKVNTANVKIYDTVGNFKQISCNVVDNSYLAPIKPSSSENVVKKSETDTLKIYITKKNSYYITRVWAYDPYYQLNKYDSPEYGTKLYNPKDLLQMAINRDNLSNNLIVGFNASGFYLKDTYDADSVSKYSKYDKTSVGTLVITNGQVIRNVYDKAYKTWYITGVDPSNTLKIFTDEKASTASEINAKKEWANSVINSKIRNTFTFASPLIMNGVKSDIITSMPSASSRVSRQAICQVNSNNFVLITGYDLNRNDLIQIMLNLNCQTGTNLDGGGSIALLYKEPNNSSISTIIGNGRNLTEVGYFTELEN